MKENILSLSDLICYIIHEHLKVGMDGYLEKVWVWTWISIIHTHPVLLPSLSQTLSSIFLVIGFTSQQGTKFTFQILILYAYNLTFVSDSFGLPEKFNF